MKRLGSVGQGHTCMQRAIQADWSGPMHMRAEALPTDMNIVGSIGQGHTHVRADALPMIINVVRLTSTARNPLAPCACMHG